MNAPLSLYIYSETGLCTKPAAKQLPAFDKIKKRSTRCKHCALPMQTGSVLHLCSKFEADSSIRSKVIKGSKISKLGYVTQATPTWGSFIFRMQAGPIFISLTKFEADCTIHSKLIKGVQKLGHVTLATPIYGLVWYTRV